MNIGYARVSTKDQVESLHAQSKTLRDCGCAEIYAEVASGVRSQRLELEAALKASREGDTLVVTRLDRLGRSTLDTLTTLKRIDAKGVRVRALDLDLDTHTPAGKLVISVIAALGQWERDLLVARTREGLVHARQQGRVGGRPPKLTQDQQQAALRLLAGGMSENQVATTLGVSRSTIARLKAKHRRN